MLRMNLLARKTPPHVHSTGPKLPSKLPPGSRLDLASDGSRSVLRVIDTATGAVLHEVPWPTPQARQ